MANKKIGPIHIIQGETNSRVPYSTSLLIEGAHDTTLIDCGSGIAILNSIKTNFSVSALYLTHYHIDHVWGAYLFNEAKRYINTYDYKKLRDPYELANVNGISVLHSKEAVEKWVQTHFTEGRPLRPGSPDYKPIMGTIHHTYPYDVPLDVSGTSMIMLHLPGHTEGYCCPYFPNEGVLFVGDFDLTSFGPWYNNCDSDIELFEHSASKTLEIDANYFITSHQKGSFDRKDYVERLKNYIDIIYRREEQTKRAIESGIPPEDLVWQEVFYFKSNHQTNPYLMESEIIGLAKHIKLLIKKGYAFEDYYQAFCNYYHINDHALSYKSEPVSIF